MEKPFSFGTLAIVAILSAAVFRAPAAERSRTGSGESVQHPAGSSPQPAAHRTARNAPEDSVDALGALADSLGVDITTESLKRRALRRAKDLSDRKESANAERDVRFLWTLLQLLPRNTLGLDEVKQQVLAAATETSVRLREEPLATPNVTEQFLTRYFNGSQKSPGANGPSPAADGFESLDTGALKLEVLRHEADSHNIRVRFLIATLPDPVDSYTGWQFDPMLDAIAQAISASGYTLDRFYFPDVDEEPDANDGSSAERGRAHEDKPSLVIFRKHSPSGSERLVLQVVHETPTAGVHARAFARAVRTAARWTGATGAGDACGGRALGDRACVRILGPTFSGTVDSMARGLEMAKSALDTRSVWIVSGSATAAENSDTFERLRDAPDFKVPLAYQATVQPDDVLVRALIEHIVSLGWSGSLAVLFEGNTQYGQQILRQVRLQETAGLAPRRFFPEILQAPFPMNISRLRSTSTSDQPEINRALGMPSRFRALPMEQRGTPSDQLPTLWPTTAASYLEIEMSGMLQALARERVRTVALMATDPRDKLYLAQQLARFAPDLSIVTAESDSLYAHPDYVSYLQGALVASTYPLHAGNQRWSDGFGGTTERRQFANGSSQGIYNAALALLNYSPDGLPTGDGTHVPRLVEYGPPAGDEACRDGCQPPAWISVVGRNGLWPLRAYVSQRSSPPGPVFRVRMSSQPARDAPMTFPSPLFAGLCGILAGLAGLCWFTVGRLEAPLVRRSALALRSGRSPLWWVASLGAVILLVGSLLIARFRIERTALSGLAVVASALTLPALAVIARRSWAASRDTDRDRAPADRSVALWHVALAVLTVWGFANLFAYAWSNTVAPPADLLGYVTRAMALDSGVSSVLPVALLSVALALWAGVAVTRARTPHAALTEPRVQDLMRHGGRIEDVSGPWTFFNGPITAVPWRLQLAVAAAAGMTCLVFDPIVRPLVSAEGVQFGRFVSAAILGLQLVMGLALGQFVYLWWQLTRLLHRLEWHPWVDAYQRVPPELFPPALWPAAPRLIELRAAVSRCREFFAAALPPAPFDGPPPVECHELERVYDEELQTAPDTFWSQSRTWSMLVSTIAICCDGAEVAALGRGRGGYPPASLAMAASNPGMLPGHQTPAAVPVQDLFAISMAFIIRDALARLRHNLTFIMCGAVLIFCSHALFPFQPHRQIEALAWTYIAILFSAIVTVLVQMKRNAIISRLASATPADRRTWDGALVLKLAMFLLIPLLTLFAAQFPDLGGLILHWTEPVKNALP